MENKIEGELKYIFSNINSWLNFAEIKNSALGVSNVAIIAFLISDMKSILTVKYFSIMISLFIVSLIIVTISFIPILQEKILKSRLMQRQFKKNIEKKNLLFYGYISNLTKEEYLSTIFQKYTGKNINIQQTEYAECLDLSDEIVINSRITVYKYSFFRWASVPMIIGLVMLLLCFLCG